MTRSFIVHTEWGERLKFRSMTGRERISTLFEYRVRLISDTLGISPSSPGVASSLPMLTAHGSAARTRTRTGCCANTSPKALICLAGASMRSKPWPGL